MKPTGKVYPKSKLRGKHSCYYGYVKTPRYRVYCPLCKKILKSNLVILSSLSIGAVTLIGAVYYLS